MDKVVLFECDLEGEVGLDVRVCDASASVSDLLSALQCATDNPHILKPFHRQRYASCAGCVNNCCKYNYITPDLVAVNALAAKLGVSVAAFAKEYLDLSPDLQYAEFRQRPCPFLQENRCTTYHQRALICRLYLCTPMTDRLERLRAAVSFAGEAALRQLLVDLRLAPTNWSPQVLRKQLRQSRKSSDGDLAEQLELLLDHNPFDINQGYDQVNLRDCCTDQLWDELTNERDSVKSLSE